MSPYCDVSGRKLHFFADAIFNHSGDRNTLRRGLRGLLIVRAHLMKSHSD